MERTLHNEDAARKLQQLKEQNLILLECIVGSQAYGTAIEGSDIDKKFIYIEPLENVLSDTYTQQLNVDKDYVGYEISRFCELIAKGNPNMLDLLNMPDDCIISKSPLFKEYFEDNMHRFITKKIEGAFGRYAHDQIAKAHGANKKVMDPMEKERKGLLDFCWVASGQGTIPLKSLIYSKTSGEEIPFMFGVQALDHMKNCYNLYIDKKYQKGYLQWVHDHGTKQFPPEAHFHAHRSYKGITDVDDVQIVLSSIKRGAKPIATFYCNIEGFQTYCKKYKEYWAWVEDRNELRYQTNVSVGKGYDTKNMAHCHRLLNMCIEILEKGELNIRRSESEVAYLLYIRAGKEEYNDLVNAANKKIERIKELAETSTLPDEVEPGFIPNILFEIRKRAYNLTYSFPSIN